MVREPIVQDNISPRNYLVEGDIHITQPYVQPVQQRENIKLEW